jgi:hypothetical protein
MLVMGAALAAGAVVAEFPWAGDADPAGPGIIV